MELVYIAGPVVRDGESISPEINQLYSQLRKEFVSRGSRVHFPIAEKALEQASPKTFYKEISHRINSSDTVVAVFTENNPSAIVEATMASFMEKALYIVAEDINEIPRILRGLPNVKGILQYDINKDTFSEMKE